MSFQFAFVEFIVLVLKNIKNHLQAVLVCLLVVQYGLRCNFCGKRVRKMKFSCGDTAKSDAFQMIRCRQFQTGAVAASKLFAVFLCDGFMDRWTNGVKNILTRQIIAFCDFCPSRFFWFSLLIHDAGTFQTKLHACSGMDGIVNATMTGNKAA